MLAALGGYFDVAKALVDAGASLLIEDESVGTALDYANETGNEEILWMLRNALPEDMPESQSTQQNPLPSGLTKAPVEADDGILDAIAAKHPAPGVRGVVEALRKATRNRP